MVEKDCEEKQQKVDCVNIRVNTVTLWVALQAETNSQSSQSHV